MSLVDDGKIPETPPSQDPNRQEVLIISENDVTNNKTRTCIFKMMRDDQGEVRELQSMTKGMRSTESQSPLLEAIVNGYDMGSEDRTKLRSD